MKNLKNRVLMPLTLVLSLGTVQHNWPMGDAGEGDYTDYNFNKPSSGLTPAEKEQQFLIEEQEHNKPKSTVTQAIDWLKNKVSGQKTATGVELDSSHDTSHEPGATETSGRTGIPFEEPGVSDDSGPHSDQNFKKSSLKDNINSIFIRDSGLKIKRTQLQAELTSITRTEILSTDTYAQAKAKFIESAAIIRPLLPANVILIPIERPSTQFSNNFANDFQFELVNMDGYDPKLTIEQNAEQIKKIQGLKIQARDTLTNDTRTLAAYIRRYLEENPSKDNLKALLFDNKRGKNGLKEILTNPEMKTLFNNISAQELTDITNKQYAAVPKALMTPSSMLYGAAKHFFQFKAEDYQPFFTDKLIIPIESASRNNRASFNFDIIDISQQKSALESTEPDLTKIAQELKIEQNLKLTVSEIEKQLKIYLKNQTKEVKSRKRKNKPTKNKLTSLTPTNINIIPEFNKKPLNVGKNKPTRVTSDLTSEGLNIVPALIKDSLLDETSSTIKNSTPGMSDTSSDFSKSTNSQPEQPQIIRLDSPLTSAQNRTTYLAELTDNLDQHFKSATTDPNSKISQLIKTYQNLPVIYDPAARRTLTISSDGYGLLKYDWSDTPASRESYSALEELYQTTLKNIKSEMSKQVPDNEPIPLSDHVKVTINKNTQAEIVNAMFNKYFEPSLSDIQKEKLAEYIKERIKDEDNYEQIKYDELMARTTNRPNPFLSEKPITLSAENLTKKEQQNLALYLNNKMKEIFTPEKMTQLQESTIMDENIQDQFVKTRIKGELRKILPVDKTITLPNGQAVNITQDLQNKLVQEAWENNFAKTVIVPDAKNPKKAIPWGIFVFQPSQ